MEKDYSGEGWEAIKEFLRENLVLDIQAPGPWTTHTTFSLKFKGDEYPFCVDMVFAERRSVYS